MRIALAALGQIEFLVDTPYQVPLGGSQSALCYMAEALAHQGHEVSLLSSISKPVLSRGVQCLPATPSAIKSLPPLDAFLVKNFAGHGPLVRSLLAGKSRLLLFWTGHDIDQPAIRALQSPAEQKAYDGLAFVSEWQRQQYLRHFRLHLERTALLRYAIGPAFRGLFPAGSSVLSHKPTPPVLAYTSTPFRGLEVLLDVLPDICRLIPGTRLKVFSSMRVYQLTAAQDDAKFGHLYRRCREMAQVDYVGSVPQPALAGEMRSVSLLAYPNTFAETSCIAALEALAAGCFVVTSQLGALPETTAGFARLIPFDGNPDAGYRRNFVEAVVQCLAQQTGPGAVDAEAQLQRQIAFVNQSYNWSVRAQELVQWINTLAPRPSGRTALPPAPVKETAEAHNERGVTLVFQAQLEQAAAHFQRALQLKPDFVNAHNNLGNVLKRMARLPEAIACYRRAVELNPAYAEALVNLGDALSSQRQLPDAIASYRRALELKPDFAGAYCSLANALKDHGQLSEAIVCYEQALKLQPNHAEALNNLGVALMAQEQTSKAIPLFQRALQLLPDLAGVHLNLGAAFKAQGNLQDAVSSFHRAIKLQPAYVEAHLNLGTVLLDQGRLPEAIACLQQALRLKPDIAEAHRSLAHAFADQGQTEEAIACYRRALQCSPANLTVLGDLIHQLQAACLWPDLTDLAPRLLQSIERDAADPAAGAVSPLTVLALPPSTTPLQHLQCARQWAKLFVKSPPLIPHPSSLIPHPLSLTPHPSPRIAIGYLSADFHAHATAYLIAELIEQHDRDRFAVFGYSYGPVDNSPIRRRLVQAFDRFVELGDFPHPVAARQIAADGIDILVDLKGSLRLARPQITALRPAPIQVNYLGYPGTMAAPFVDFILVDHFVVPPDQQPFFTEKLVHLPGCYQVNDSRREIATRTPSRAECGLPESGFVFCCFNNSWKITAEIFDVWMRLLRAVDGSLLWLLESNPFAAANLRREAQTRAVSADRLVFAPHLPLPDHLARHRLADLVLDTVPYNAHTTASDALWAGCPLLTIAGQTFPSRVAGSLLSTIGLSELITTTLEEYYDLALRLARDPALLAEVRARLHSNRNTSPLFDGNLFARNIEKAFTAMWQIHTAGQPPQAFMVESK